jgi:UPF0755 protein
VTEREQSDQSANGEPAARPRRALALALKLAGATALGLGLLGGWLLMSQQRHLATPLAVPEQGLLFELRPGTSLGQATRELEAMGVMEQSYFLLWHARWHGKSARIKAGEYRIPVGATPLALLDQLMVGKVVQHPLTIVEGWTFKQLLAAVKANDTLEHTLGGLPGDRVMERLGFPGVHPEGRFFADTYHFPRGTRDVDFLRRAHMKIRDYVAGAWPDRAANLPLETPEEALILASIVEKETGVANERARIAGVFLRRLEKGMRLETDPTVIYGLGESFDGNLRRRDLRADTPYNTYTRKGLPPTPIAIPSAAAIHAVLHPGTDDALFFVAKGDGSHHFSATYEEHRKAVNRYQKRRGTRSTATSTAGKPDG